ncbi:BnaC09g12050D [Brassica napus]|uniref:BnaC09g12050D protein n=1 Tax=Brassica napus TaxID=3708 RepID=A0A078F4P1_BRANA|nr:BnaC09g12050D [Brassica napus]
MSCIRYGEGGKGMADGGCSVSSIEVGMSVAVEMSYWLGEHGSCAVGEREAPVQISKDKDFDLFTSARKVDKYINVFVTFKEEIDGKIHFLRPMGNLLKSKEVASSNEMQVGSTSADVHTRNEVNDGETDLTEDEIILMGVAEIEAVYASNGFGMRERTANPPSTFEDYVDEGRDYIGSSRISMENIEEASNNLGVKSSDQVADTENHSDPNQEEDPSLDNSSQMLDDDFVEPVPQCVSGGQTHETLVGEDEDDDFIEPVPQSRSREEDARRRREKDKADDESLMKSVRAVELYGFEDVEASSNNEAVNDYTVDDIDFTLADADMYTGKLFSSKQGFKISEEGATEACLHI